MKVVKREILLAAWINNPARPLPDVRFTWRCPSEHETFEIIER